MGFFKNLFSSKKDNVEGHQKLELNQVMTNEYFDKRYTEEDIYKNPTIMDGCLKLIGGFFEAHKTVAKIPDPINHPINLDQLFDEGLGFKNYCMAFQIEEVICISTLAFAFSDFLIKKFGFKLYKDSEPENPLRVLTLKYDRNGTILSIYPMECSIKVLNYEANFVDLYKRLEASLETLPNAEEYVNDILNKLKN